MSSSSQSTTFGSLEYQTPLSSSQSSEISPIDNHSSRPSTPTHTPAKGPTAFGSPSTLSPDKGGSSPPSDSAEDEGRDSTRIDMSEYTAPDSQGAASEQGLFSRNRSPSYPLIITSLALLLMCIALISASTISLFYKLSIFEKPTYQPLSNPLFSIILIMSSTVSGSFGTGLFITFICHKKEERKERRNALSDFNGSEEPIIPAHDDGSFLLHTSQ